MSLRLQQCFVYFSESGVRMDPSTEALYRIQQKLYEHWQTPYRVYSNLDPVDEHFIKVENVPHLNLSGSDRLKANKIPIIRAATQMIDKDEVLLVHDFDAFQNKKIVNLPLQLEDCDLLVTMYNHRCKVNTGVLFARGQSQSVQHILTEVDKIQLQKGSCWDERCLTWLLNQFPLNESIAVLSQEWNFGRHQMEESWSGISWVRPYFVHLWPPATLSQFIDVPVLDPFVQKLLEESIDDLEGLRA